MDWYSFDNGFEKLCTWIITIDLLKFRFLVACQERHRQKVQTQIRLLQKHSDQDIPCLLFWKEFVNSSHT